MFRKSVLYPTIYSWFLFAASLDVLLTWLILGLGGGEANYLADRVFVAAGFPGIVALKFTSVIIVVLICEYVGQRRYDIGRRLAGLAAAVNCVPILLAAVIVADFLVTVFNR
jgi:hypothetical protein